MKRPPVEWERTVISDMTFNKELKSKIYKQITQFNIKKSNKQSNKKIGQRFGWTFFKEDIQIANKHMKKCSASLINQEIQIKAPLRYYLIPFVLAIIKKDHK